jgi:hypothetical protein
MAAFRAVFPVSRRGNWQTSGIHRPRRWNLTTACGAVLMPGQSFVFR